jgi:Tetratricopeptide repeat
MLTVLHARALMQLGDVDGACDAYAKSIEAQPTHAKAWYNLGFVKADLDDQVWHHLETTVPQPARTSHVCVVLW